MIFYRSSFNAMVAFLKQKAAEGYTLVAVEHMKFARRHRTIYAGLLGRDSYRIQLKKIALIATLLIPLNVHAASMTFLLEWLDNSNNEDGFILEQRLGDNAAPWSAVEELAENTTTRLIELSGTPDFLNIRRCYRVRAFNVVAVSNASNTKCVRMTF